MSKQRVGPILSASEYEAIDTACRALRKVASAGNCRVEVDVRRDGRVEISGEDSFTRWLVRGDLAPGGALELPSSALSDALIDANAGPSCPAECPCRGGGR